MHHTNKQKHHTSTTTTTTTLEEWRQKCINGGSLRHVDLTTGSNGWASPPGNNFSLRGPTYLNSSKKTKIPAGDYLLSPAGVDWLRSTSKLDHVLSRTDNRVINSLNSVDNVKNKLFLLAVNLQVPGREHHSAVFYFVTEYDKIDRNSLFYRFINGTDSFRNSRFKLVNKIVKGPWIVKAAVGNYSACLLGKALNCSYYRGEGYLEIDVDIGSSAIASAICRIALGCVTSVTVDMGFVVEGVCEEELPERLFGAVRICQMEMGSASFVDGGTGTSRVLPMDTSGGESEND